MKAAARFTCPGADRLVRRRVHWAHDSPADRERCPLVCGGLGAVMRL